MKSSSAAGSTMAARQGRYGQAAQDRARAATASAALAPLPVTPPNWLTPAAAAIWREVLPHVIERAAAPDARLFGSWCIASAEITHWAASKAKAAGEHLRAAQRIQLAIGNSLGLTPLGRAKIPPLPKEKQLDPREATIASLVR